MSGAENAASLLDTTGIMPFLFRLKVFPFFAGVHVDSEGYDIGNWNIETGVSIKHIITAFPHFTREFLSAIKTSDWSLNASVSFCACVQFDSKDCTGKKR